MAKREMQFYFQGPPKPPIICSPWQPRVVKCLDCPAEFQQRAATQKRCPDCAAAAKLRTQQRGNEKLKAKRKAAKEYSLPACEQMLRESPAGVARLYALSQGMRLATRGDARKRKTA